MHAVYLWEDCGLNMIMIYYASSLLSIKTVIMWRYCLSYYYYFAIIRLSRGWMLTPWPRRMNLKTRERSWRIYAIRSSPNCTRLAVEHQETHRVVCPVVCLEVQVRLEVTAVVVPDPPLRKSIKYSLHLSHRPFQNQSSLFWIELVEILQHHSCCCRHSRASVSCLQYYCNEQRLA